MLHTPQKNKKTTIALSILVALLLVSVLGYGVYAYTTSAWPFSSSQEDEQPRGVNDVDYGPPSEEDVEQSQNGKQTNEDRDEQPTTPDGTTNRVDVAVSFADLMEGRVEVRAFIPGVIESDGTCTATLTKNGRTVSGNSAAFIDASSTQCPPIYIPVANFPERGEWSLTVNYSSPTSSGSSEQLVVRL